MKLDIAELERLATILETKAKTADAKAYEHAQAKEFAESEKESKRADGGRHFAKICREAHRLLASRQKREVFTPPSWEEVFAYAHARYPRWPREDVLAWFNHFESNGWLVSGKARMVNWKSGADNGYRHWNEKHPEKPKTPTGNPRTGPDPEGWREYLKSLARPYKEYRFEQEHVKFDFKQSRRVP
jgi:hypothetical protein